MSRFSDLSDIQQLANRYDPNYSKPLTFDLRPAFERTGDLRQDVYNLIVSKREDEIVGISRTLGLSNWKVSQVVQQFVREGVLTQEQVYTYLPKIREAHERNARRRQRQQQQR
ncbi:MAG: hypothetical protein U0223_11685 [Nitrospira sp.]|nr:hypothetical protein [Nitrospira sp.]